MADVWYRHEIVTHCSDCHMRIGRFFHRREPQHELPRPHEGVTPARKCYICIWKHFMLKIGVHPQTVSTIELPLRWTSCDRGRAAQ